jgi:CheY-like chemotaxis protein
MNFLQTILLVDEDPAVRGMMAQSLGKMGYRIAETDSADGVRQLAALELPALILVDRGLPGAPTILASLKDDPVVGQNPVMMTSARAAMLS